jgi:hypothetical protein
MTVSYQLPKQKRGKSNRETTERAKCDRLAQRHALTRLRRSIPA